MGQGVIALQLMTWGITPFSLPLACIMLPLLLSATSPHTIFNIAISRGTTTTVDFALQPQPTGTFRVHIYEATTGRPLTATISVPGTPLTATASSWSFSLPPGDYTVMARVLSYRVGITMATIAGGETTEVTHRSLIFTAV